MNKAFTLIEILVVVSIIGMLSSVTVASVGPARAQARDAARSQQIAQINNAVQLYIADKGHAPELTGCQIQEESMTESEVISGCIAVSTQGATPGTPWRALQDQLSPYISSLPSDPCPSCASGSGYPLGYTYVSPAAMQYYCDLNGDCVADDSSYQTYASLERNTSLSGSGGSSGSTYYPDPTPPPTITSVPAQIDNTFPVVIHGTNFGDYVHGAPLTITFTAVNSPYSVHQFTSFIYDMNAGPTTVTLYISGMAPGPYRITATTPDGTSNAMISTMVK